MKKSTKSKLTIGALMFLEILFIKGFFDRIADLNNSGCTYFPGDRKACGPDGWLHLVGILGIIIILGYAIWSEAIKLKKNEKE